MLFGRTLAQTQPQLTQAAYEPNGFYESPIYELSAEALAEASSEASPAPQFQCDARQCKALNNAASERGFLLAIAINAAARVLDLTIRAPESGDISTATFAAAQAVADARPVLSAKRPEGVKALRMLEELRARRVSPTDLANSANEAAFNFLHVVAHGKLPTANGGGGKVTVVALAAATIVIMGGFLIMVSSSRQREKT
jgi:hypothetical protein